MAVNSVCTCNLNHYYQYTCIGAYLQRAKRVYRKHDFRVSFTKFQPFLATVHNIHLTTSRIFPSSQILIDMLENTFFVVLYDRHDVTILSPFCHQIVPGPAPHRIFTRPFTLSIPLTIRCYVEFLGQCN